LLVLPVAAQTGDAGWRLRAQVEALNQELARVASISPGAAQFAALLETRARLLIQLMTVDPLQVRGLGLPPSVMAQAGRGMSGPSVESIGPWSGTLEAAVEDDWERGSSRTNWYMRTNGQNGSRLQLHFGFTPRQRAGAAVRVEGLAIAGQVAVSGIAAQAAEPAVPTPQQCTTIGPQNIAVLMLTTPSFPSLPLGYTPSRRSLEIRRIPTAPHL
jgi:hypothetical protein